MSVSTGNIVVADDDPGIRDAVELMLSDIGGYQVVTVSDGDLLLKMDHTHTRLILLDLWMSGVNGSEICQVLKSQNETKGIPIIIFSANRDIKIISTEVGADDYIAKPFQMKELLGKIEKHAV